MAPSQHACLLPVSVYYLILLPSGHTVPVHMLPARAPSHHAGTLPVVMLIMPSEKKTWHPQDHVARPGTITSQARQKPPGQMPQSHAQVASQIPLSEVGTCDAKVAHVSGQLSEMSIYV